LKIVPDVAGAKTSWAKAKKLHAREVSKEREAENMKKVCKISSAHLLDVHQKKYVLC
jgi:hypothetical protein